MNSPKPDVGVLWKEPSGDVCVDVLDVEIMTVGVLCPVQHGSSFTGVPA
jgi:hypothetical protein